LSDHGSQFLHASDRGFGQAGFAWMMMRI